MPTGMLIRNGHRGTQAPQPAVPAERDELRVAVRTRLERVRRLRLHVAAWVVGTIALTTLWVVNQWQANGALERFGHEGEPGQWNPTLWALGVGIWGLIVGIMALRLHFERPATQAEVDLAVERLPNAHRIDELRRVARARLERIGRIRFHVAAWVLGMLVLTPLWALIEWQDNGGFQRFSDNSTPGDWDPWILILAGVWALVVAVLAIRVACERPVTEEQVDREVERLAPRG